MKKFNKANEILALSDGELLFVSGGKSGTASRIVKGVFEGVAISVLSGLVLAEGKNLMNDISLDDENWNVKKSKRAENSFIKNCKCIGGPLNAASGLYYKAHNGIVDVARTPWSELSKKI